MKPRERFCVNFAAIRAAHSLPSLGNIWCYFGKKIFPNWKIHDCCSVCEEGAGVCATLMTIISLLIILASLPFSLFFVVKVVQEYERAVIFRLGRLLTGGARGPGVFFVIPCVDVYEKIDMRSQTYEIPPQEVLILLYLVMFHLKYSRFSRKTRWQCSSMPSCTTRWRTPSTPWPT